MNIPKFAGTFDLRFNPNPILSSDAKNEVAQLYEELSEPKNLLISVKGVNLTQGIRQFPDHIQIQCHSRDDEKVKTKLLDLSGDLFSLIRAIMSIDYQSSSGKLPLNDLMG